MYRITKHIDFCYGHRLLNYDGKCRNLHGHNGRVEFELSGETLDARGMLADFGDVKRLMKPWIDEHLDHRMILRVDDPAVDFIQSRHEPIFIMDENPTAEALARLLFTQCRAFNLPVSRVTLWETPDSYASYSEPEGVAEPGGSSNGTEAL